MFDDFLGADLEMKPTNNYNSHKRGLREEINNGEGMIGYKCDKMDQQETINR